MLIRKTVNAAEYSRLTSTVVGILREGFQGVEIQPVRRCKNEEFDYLILIMASTEANILSKLRTLSKECGSLTKEHTYYLYCEGFYTEIIVVPAEMVGYAVQHHSYDGIGFILGRLLWNMGLKSNERGLQYTINEKMFDGDLSVGKNMEDVPISSEYKVAIELLGLDYPTFCTPSQPIEFYVEWLEQSPVFHPDIFMSEVLLEKLLQRSGNKHKATFEMFQSRVNSMRIGDKVPTNPSQHIKALSDRFTFLKSRIFACCAKFLRKREIQRKCNGDLIRTWLSLPGDTLVGNIVSAFRRRFEELEILAMSQEEVRDEVVKLYQSEA